MAARPRLRNTLLGILLLAIVAYWLTVTYEPTVSPYGICPGSALGLPDTDLLDSQVETRLQSWVELLASPGLAGRRAGTFESREVVGLLARALETRDLDPPAEGSCLGYPLLGETDHDLVGFRFGIPGSPWVVIGAHYDGRGVHPGRGILPGADDNASGVAALLEIAHRIPRDRSLGVHLAFVLFGAEEVGFVGARRWVSHPVIDLDEVELILNLDMVGRPLPDGGSGIGFLVEGGEEWRLLRHLSDATEQTTVRTVPLERWQKREVLLSDSLVFPPQLPSLLLSTGLHEDHHQPTDTAERIHPDQIARAVELAIALAREAGTPLD